MSFGRELRTLPVLLAYVTACGGDRVEWEARWQEVSGQLESGTGARRDTDTGNADTGNADTAERRLPGPTTAVRVVPPWSRA